MNIAILGAGHIGGTLAKKLAAHGHTVVVGVRDPLSPKVAALQQLGLTIGTIEEAVAAGELVVVALPLAAALAILPQLDLAGKILVDSTNGFQGLPAGFGAAGAAVAAAAPYARVVKAWNATPWDALDNPIYSGMVVETFICGDDASAKAIVGELVKQTGLQVIDIGGLDNAILSEHFAKLWGTIAYQAGMGRGFAFKMLSR